MNLTRRQREKKKSVCGGWVLLVCLVSLPYACECFCVVDVSVPWYAVFPKDESNESKDPNMKKSRHEIHEKSASHGL